MVVMVASNAVVDVKVSSSMSFSYQIQRVCACVVCFLHSVNFKQ